MADNTLPGILQVLGFLTGKQPDLPPGRAGLAALIPRKEEVHSATDLSTGETKKPDFWSKPSGSALATILGTLLTTGLGAGIGAISSPRARGLGAARGAGIGMGMGVLEDLGLRKSAASSPILGEKMKAEKAGQALDAAKLAQKSKTDANRSALEWSKLSQSRKKDERLAEYQKYIKSYNKMHPNSTPDEFVGRIQTKFHDIVGLKTEDELLSLADKVVGSPATEPGLFSRGQPRIPGIYDETEDTAYTKDSLKEAVRSGKISREEGEKLAREMGFIR